MSCHRVSAIAVTLILWLFSVLVSCPVAAVQDSDGDSLPDPVERQLATDPNFAEELELVGEFPTKEGCPPEFDVTKVYFGNVAQDRWLWAIHFAAPYSFDNSSLIVYFDTDNNPGTGRTDMGCELMVSHAGGAAGCTAFAPDGSYTAAPGSRVAVVEGVLYLCHDAEVLQQDGRCVFRYTVLSETREPHESKDSTGWREASGPPNSDRKKVLTLDDITEDENFEVTEGLDLIWELVESADNIVFSSPEAELQGMRYYDTEYRWPAVYGTNGTITVTVPRAGTFYPAVVVYDTGGKQTYEMSIEGEVVGRFVAAEDDNRQRVHFLDHAIEFAGGEKLTIRVGSVGQNITEDIILLGEKPPIRTRKYELSHTKAGFVRRDGQDQMRLTWITTWPAQCTIQYGKTANYEQTAKEAEPLANHRLYLTALEPGATYHYRIVAPKPDGEEVISEDMTFTFEPPLPFKGTVARASVPLTVENPYDFAVSGSPVSSGVPFAQGELGDVANLRLLRPDGKETPIQALVTARWGDGSIKWVLITFMANARANGAPVYTLEYGTEVSRTQPDLGLRARQNGDILSINTGPLQVEFDAAQSGFPSKLLLEGKPVSSDLMMGVRIVDDNGIVYTTNNPPELIEIEEAGPLRVVVFTRGHHLSEGHEQHFAYESRFVFYAGCPYFRAYYAWGNDLEPQFSHFQSITLHLPMDEAGEPSWAVGRGDGQQLSGSGGLDLMQLRDDSFELEPAVASGDMKLRRADGWLDAKNGDVGIMLAVRDFWELYPKSLAVREGELQVGICPDFPDGYYDDCSKLDEIKLYYYLMGGKYKIKQGVKKWHEMLMLFHDGEPGQQEHVQLAQEFEEPLIAVCPPGRYCDTLVFGRVLPATTGRMPEYEEVCEKVYQGYTGAEQGGKWYGMHNYGDWWGERRVNWGNGEYDYHHAFLMQFIRCAERKWYFRGEKAARHANDIDTCHFGPRIGGEWVHSMGHVGDYFSEQYEGSGIPRGGFTVSHTWTEGFCDWYFLSGDRTASENAGLVADHFDGTYLNNYDYGNCRTNGWHLILTMAAYHATDDPYYLNAAHIIIERTLERQTPGQRGWHRQMVPGHCYCMPRCRGEANFMLGVLCNGLETYYEDTQDERVADAIVGGANMAIAEMWVDEVNGFKYTSCKEMKGYTANNDMTVAPLFFAYRYTGEPHYADIAMRAMKAAFESGLGAISHMRWTPRIVYYMDLIAREGPALDAKQGAQILLENEDGRPFDLWLRRVNGGQRIRPGAARLTSPDGETFPPDHEGRISVTEAVPGVYRLAIRPRSAAWQVQSSLPRWVVGGGDDLVVVLGKLPCSLGLRPSRGAERVRLSAESIAGVVKAKLILPDGGTGVREGQRVRFSRRVRGDNAQGTWRLDLQGTGRVRLRLEEAAPYVALSAPKYFNPSVPLATILGDCNLGPGDSAVELEAVAHDLEGDIVAYTWKFDDGTIIEGQTAEHSFTTGGIHQVTLTVTDAAGNVGTTSASITMPPPLLTDIEPERLVLVQAEDFVDQGLDEVNIFDRIGNVGKMISVWEKTIGHWLEWEAPIEVEGDYVIYLRYASGGTKPRRALTIDGVSPGAAFDEMAFAPTGGYCTASDNWAVAAAGGGQPIHLEVGKHRLRMINLGDGLALDYIALVRQ